MQHGSISTEVDVLPEEIKGKKRKGEDSRDEGRAVEKKEGERRQGRGKK